MLRFALGLVIWCVSLVPVSSSCPGDSTKTAAVFSAARTISLPFAYDQVPYDVILEDTLTGFNAAKTTYTVKSAGFYFMHLSAGVPKNTKLNCAIRNATSTPNVLLSHTSLNDDIMTSRDDIQYLSDGQELYVSSDYALYSDGMMQTSWSGFKLDDVINMEVVFRAARVTSIINSPRYAVLPLDKLIINIGQAWDACNSQLVVPKTGIYFLSWSSASLTNSTHFIELQVNGAAKSRSFISGTNPGSDTSSQALLLPLKTGDVVKLILAYPEVVSVNSDMNYQTSFSGFLYEPVHGQAVAWSLTVPSESDYVGPAVINFTIIYLNEGSTWNSSAAALQISTSGIYYVKLSGFSYNVFNLAILVNNQLLMNVVDKVDASSDVRSRALIVHLNAGDQLTVGLPTGYQASSYWYDMVFAGFLIQPDVDTNSRLVSSQSKISTKKSTCATSTAAVFSAVQSTVVPVATQKVQFESILVDTVGGFDTGRTTYTANSSGFYLFHFSAGMPAYEQLNYAMHGAPSTPNVLVTHTKYDGETVTSRDDIQYITEGQELYMSTDYPLYNDGLLQTTWGGFKLDDVMSPLSVFRAARTSSYMTGGYIPLDKMLLNVGNAMSQCNNTHLVVQRTGVYFVSWSAASPSNITQSVLLYVNGASLSRIVLQCGDFNGIDMSSQSIILQLNAGETLSLLLSPSGLSSSGSSASYSDASYQTSLTGFLYEPVHGHNVAWSLGVPRGVLYGPININFTNILVDTSGVWNSSTGNLKVPVSGLYYLKISSGPYWEYKLNMVLTVNSNPLMNVIDKMSKTCSQYWNSRSRSIITRLQQGDILTVTVPNGYVAWDHLTDLVFAGFLISP